MTGNENTSGFKTQTSLGGLRLPPELVSAGLNVLAHGPKILPYRCKTHADRAVLWALVQKCKSAVLKMDFRVIVPLLTELSRSVWKNLDRSQW